MVNNEYNITSIGFYAIELKSLLIYVTDFSFKIYKTTCVNFQRVNRSKIEWLT